ncbi:MAG TPA: hypothetical protein VGF18_04255, partial [Candidatus Tumulicola sp.]
TSRYDSHLRRGDWDVRAVASTRIWSGGDASAPEFRYSARVETFAGGTPFARRDIEGRIRRRWI